jgi:hypothetical protein
VVSAAVYIVWGFTCLVEMLYILPPPSAPSPPSPWTTILCGNDGQSSGGSVRDGTVKTAAAGLVAPVVQGNSWVSVTASSRRPPAARGHVPRSLKNRVSCCVQGLMSVSPLPCLQSNAVSCSP